MSDVHSDGVYCGFFFLDKGRETGFAVVSWGLREFPSEASPQKIRLCVLVTQVQLRTSLQKVSSRVPAVRSTRGLKVRSVVGPGIYRSATNVKFVLSR